MSKGDASCSSLAVFSSSVPGGGLSNATSQRVRVGKNQDAKKNTETCSLNTF